MSLKTWHCPECEQSKFSHLQNWFEEIINTFFLPNFLIKFSARFENKFDLILKKLLIKTKLAKFETNFDHTKIYPRTDCLINEAKKNNLPVFCLNSVFGQTNHFKIDLNNKEIHFNALPAFNSTYHLNKIDDKNFSKSLLRQNNFPIAQSHAFWFWQKNKALGFAQQIGWPIVVKPQKGSVSRHVTTNIKNKNEFFEAIKHANKYSPRFIVEKYFGNGFVHRATIINNQHVVCAKQIPAHIIGNGKNTIQKLINLKNLNPGRDGKIFYQLKVDLNYLKKDLNHIPNKNEIVYLQKNPFLKLGGDIEEVSNQVHPDNKNLFFQVAKKFDLKLVGLDFVIKDINLSWKNQPCAILELNTSPCLELHHCPSIGEKTNPSKSIIDMIVELNPKFKNQNSKEDQSSNI